MQIHEENTELAEAKRLMEKKKEAVRDQTNGSTVIHDAGNLCKKAKPPVPMIFDADRMTSYFASRGWNRVSSTSSAD